MPAGHYADETPYVDAIAKAAGNIDVTYVQDDASDDLADLDRFFIALEGPVRNPTNLGWVLAILRLARTQGRRVLLGGLHGNYTVSWNGWSQTAAHLLRGRVHGPAAVASLLSSHTSFTLGGDAKSVRRTSDSGWFGDWVERRRHPNRIAAWHHHSPIRPEFAAATGVDAEPGKTDTIFCYRMRLDERIRGLFQVDYGGDWRAAEKALTGVEVRDPTADLDVISYCFGVPPEQYLAEGTDRSLIRRAMWGLLPEAVLTNRSSGLQAADWHEKLDRQRGELAREIAALSQSPLARRAIDLARLQRAASNWPSGNWHKAEIFTEYNLALMRGVAGGRFLRWFESTNCVD